MIGLCAGIFFSLLKGIDYEEAILLAIVLAILIPSRPAYYRKAKLVDQRFTPKWLVTIGIVVLAAAWLGFFSYKHVDYTNSLWWDFAFTDKAPRFLRATLVVVSLVLMFALWNLLRPGAAVARQANRRGARARARHHREIAGGRCQPRAAGR